MTTREGIRHIQGISIRSTSGMQSSSICKCILLLLLLLLPHEKSIATFVEEETTHYMRTTDGAGENCHDVVAVVVL